MLFSLHPFVFLIRKLYFSPDSVPWIFFFSLLLLIFLFQFIKSAFLYIWFANIALFAHYFMISDCLVWRKKIIDGNIKHMMKLLSLKSHSDFKIIIVNETSNNLKKISLCLSPFENQSNMLVLSQIVEIFIWFQF